MGIEAEITDYSELENYLMVARIIGKDKKGNNVYSDQCYEFLCSKSVCTCTLPSF